MKHTEISKTWFDKLAKNEPFLIAGPCSAETEEQVLNKAHAVKDTAKVYRAGIWKPRTRPGYIEGVGAPAKKWLQKVKQETGMLIATEIASAQHFGVIHRGFSTYEKTGFRNSPEQQVAIELQSKFPDLPLILDPSRIAGRRDLIGDLCQTSLDLNYDGFIIETHIDPDNAWSDASQQIDPATLMDIARNLRVRQKTNDQTEYQTFPNNIRAKIDLYDEQLLNVIVNRRQEVDKIGHLKKSSNVAVL